MGSSKSKNKEGETNSGNIHIQIPRTSFYSGDIIAGQILIDLNQSYLSKSLIIELQGEEETHFLQDQSEEDSDRDITKKRIQRSGYNQFHSLKVQAYNFRQGSEEGRSVIGQWQIPFQIVIADYLPSSFQFQQSNNQRCQLKYILKAYIESSDSTQHLIQSSQEITITSVVNSIELQPQTAQHTQYPILCFCCLSGSIRMQASINKMFYDYLEEMAINIECDTSQCTTNVPSFTIKLQGLLEMKSNSQHKIQYKFDIYKQTIQAEESKISQIVKFRIPRSANIGTQGQLIKYQNQIVIESQISSILSINSNLPLVLPFQISSHTAQINQIKKVGPQEQAIPLVPDQYPPALPEYPPFMEYPLYHAQQLQTDPVLQNMQPILYNQQEMVNYNYPSETVVIRQNQFNKQDQLQQYMPAPDMQNQNLIVT